MVSNKVQVNEVLSVILSGDKKKSFWCPVITGTEEYAVYYILRTLDINNHEDVKVFKSICRSCGIPKKLGEDIIEKWSVKYFEVVVDSVSKVGFKSFLNAFPDY